MNSSSTDATGTVFVDDDGNVFHGEEAGLKAAAFWQEQARVRQSLPPEVLARAYREWNRLLDTDPECRRERAKGHGDYSARAEQLRRQAFERRDFRFRESASSAMERSTRSTRSTAVSPGHQGHERRDGDNARSKGSRRTTGSGSGSRSPPGDDDDPDPPSDQLHLVSGPTWRLSDRREIEAWIAERIAELDRIAESAR